MPTTLDEIVAATRRKLSQARASANHNQRDIELRAQQHMPRGFRKALEAKSKGGPAIIAELKKASPSKGVIRANFDVADLAKQLEAAGASALSVLTDEEFFQGSLENLRIASSVTNLPCLRKDFIVDESQLVEARANSADAILLIVAALSQAELSNLSRRARDMGLDVLCEVHDERRVAPSHGCRLRHDRSQQPRFAYV